LQLNSLSLYDCEISDLTGVGLCENLVSLNVGRNPINLIPADDFDKLEHLETLCLDDCQLEGPLPSAITGLSNLKELRMANNRITDLTDDITKLSQLEVLSVDNNCLALVPDALTELQNLKTLLLRSNQLTSLPDMRGMISLLLLHVSSNQLTELPDTLNEVGSLTHIYCNSNQLTELPMGIETLPDLKHLNAANNAIDLLQTMFLDKFGATPDEDGVLRGKKCKVLLTGNPVLKRLKGEPNKANDADVDMQDSTDSI